MLLILQRFKLVQKWRRFPGYVSHPVVLPSSNVTIRKVQFGIYRERKGNTETPGSFHLLESEPLDKRIFCKRLFFYEYFIYIGSACVIPWLVLLLNSSTPFGVRRGEPWVWGQPNGDPHMAGFSSSVGRSGPRCMGCSVIGIPRKEAGLWPQSSDLELSHVVGRLLPSASHDHHRDRSSSLSRSQLREPAPRQDALPSPCILSYGAAELG